LIATTVIFFAPLVYVTNQELIDHYLNEASDVISTQSEQVRQVAGKHTAQATEITKQYMGDYTAKAQQLLRGRSASPEVASKPVPKETDFPAVPKQETDFPAVPKEEFKTEEEEEPLIST
jgi:hypothetical protein